MNRRLLLSCLAVTILILSACSGGGGTTDSTPSAPAITKVPASSSVIVSTTAPVLEPSTTAVPQTTPALKLEGYNGGFFSIEKPVGWYIVTAGSGSTLAFCIRDKEHPANQIFYFNEVGPVYLADEQKVVDKNYMDMGGYPVTWFEMPVVNPLTPENFLANFHLIAQTNIARSFMADIPELGDIEIISMNEETSPIPGGQTRTIRALFRQGGELGEGLFYLTVAPLIPLTGIPSGGIGYGFCFAGITAVKSDFKNAQETLTQSLNSFNISQEYIDACLQQQQQQFQGILRAGKTLSETSDIIMESWEYRNKVDDIISEKRSDVMLGNVRVYNPDTGTVYETPLGFYDEYNIRREQYNMDNLQLLPDNDWDLWTAPTESVDKID
jgi:hypothetical protein